MSLFNSQEKPQKTDSGTVTPPKIDAAVLSALELTQADIDSHYKNLEVENNKKQIAQEAISYYREVVSGSISFADAKPIKLGQIALKPEVQNVAEIPDSLFIKFKKMQNVMHPEDQAHTKIYLETFATSFGQEALKAKDWQTAVNSYDLATEGGIIHAPDIIKQLVEMYKDDRDIRLQIAEHIQKRIDNPGTNIKPTETASISSSPVSPLGMAETMAPTPGPMDTAPPVPITAPPTEAATPTGGLNIVSNEPLVQPVGTPNQTILGERIIRPAPPDPARHLP